jgi:hypothetical protein
MSDVVVLRRSEGPPLRLRARLADVKRSAGPAGVVELALYAREPIGWAVTAIRRTPEREIADAMLCEGYEDICDALEALTAPRAEKRIKPPKGGWTADAVADALTARLSCALGEAALGGLVGEALADWMRFAVVPMAAEPDAETGRRGSPARKR